MQGRPTRRRQEEGEESKFIAITAPPREKENVKEKEAAAFVANEDNTA